MVNKEDDGAALALYVIEWQRKADVHLSAASWDVARRYSEFHTTSINAYEVFVLLF